MGFFQSVLILTTFLCSLVAGFLFAFAVVVMPGIRSLNDKEFIRSFQVMDRVIQNNRPSFILVWVGSVVVLLIAIAVGVGQLDRVGRSLLIIAALVYLIGVQLPTFTINIPLNNKLQTLDVDAMDERSQKDAREEFERTWNRWNLVRAALSSLASALLIILLFRL